MKLKKIKSKKKSKIKMKKKNHDQIWKTKTWKIHIEGCNWKKKNIQKGEGHKLKFQKNEEYYSNILNQGDFHEFFNARHEF